MIMKKSEMKTGMVVAHIITREQFTVDCLHTSSGAFRGKDQRGIIRTYRCRNFEPLSQPA